MVAALVLCAGCAVEPPSAPSPDLEAQVGRREAARGRAVIVSMDAERRVPTMMWAPSGAFLPGPGQRTPEAAAWGYLEAHASLYRLTPSQLDTVYVHRVHDTGRGGLIVFFRQRVGDVPVARTELKVLMARDLSLVAITGSLHDGVAALKDEATGPRDTFAVSPALAVRGALEDLFGLSLSQEVSVQPVPSLQRGTQRFDLRASTAGERSGISLVAPATVRRVYLPHEGRLVPAYAVGVLARRAGGNDRLGYEYMVDAAQGRTLRRSNRVFQDAFSYRVWADEDGTPRDGPLVDFTPHPTGLPDATYDPGFAAPRDITREGRGPPGLDPWLDANATQTSGNNVWAYADHFDPDGYTEGRDTQATPSPGARQFHHDFDPALGPMASPSQTRAALVNLFYTTNWLHDDFYASGFTEEMGNAQQDNYLRGGEGGDALLAEGQNQGPQGSVRNNAVIFVPDDGEPPRMEMYLWEVPEVTNVRVASVDYAAGKAHFGKRTFDLTGLDLVLASSGSPSVTTACTALTNDVVGDIVLADRGGGCSYELKAVNAQNAGAAALVVLNNIPGAAPPEMFDVDTSLDATLPVLSVTYEAGVALKSLLASGGTVTGAMSRQPTRPERDGTLDNTIIAHEWGHLLHLRLVDCDGMQCRAQSEGWADFIALHMMVRPTDAFAFNGTYGVGGYAAFNVGDSPYYGVRRAPYSRDPARNALRLRHISDEEPLPDSHPLQDNGVSHSEAHNAGEIWASMLFDGYLALLDQVGKPDSPYASFAEARRGMADLVVAGMLAAPPEPTFTEQRDALLMAAWSENPANPVAMRLLAKAFADRGAGTCASAPPRRALSFEAVKESNAVQPDLRFELVGVDDETRSCDASPDGVLDAGEAGTLRLKVINRGPGEVKDTSIAFASNLTQELGLPAGPLALPTVPPFGTADLSIPISAPLDSIQPQVLELTLTPGASLSCDARPQHLFARLDHDLGKDLVDTVESPATAWTATVLEGAADQRWRREVTDESTANALNHVWHMKDDYDFADTALVSPPLKISETVPFTLRFDHRHAFAFVDRGPGKRDYWSGGVIELTVDGGQTWEDVNRYVTPGYLGTLDPTTSNNLGGRAAYVDRSSSWPALVSSPLMDFGTRFRNQTLQLRFRFGSPWIVEAHGWDIDNITLTGVVDRPPFDTLVADTGSCEPVAHAGVDQVVEGGAEVTLQGSGSVTPVGATPTFDWKQVDGPTVELTGSTTPTPRFTAPRPTGDTPLTFELTVTFGPFSTKDRVAVTVRKAHDPDPDPDPGPGPSEGGCTSAPEGRGGGSVWLASTLLLLARAWRRGGTGLQEWTNANR
ncbi:M36 family metallopeptidase [Myxococcus stipitatus]|uniref:M36 family metallopeptidase n=1 Tax=Myxococcus stipitatus TaxID=83455 RepID=UPI001F1B9C4B|nr:M36 family metallopeptidase [Myxococcus stipitatus]MCE9667316.1 M36 family metallopeptidase [Myxococcus stipitatus]